MRESTGLVPVSTKGSDKSDEVLATISSDSDEFLLTERNIEKLLDAFFSGKTSDTIRAYRSSLVSFQKFLEEPTISAAISKVFSSGPLVVNLQALDYKQALLDEDLSPQTINRRLSTIRSLVQMARMLGIINWSLEVKGVPAETYRDTRGPGLYTYKRMVQELESQFPRPKAIRDRAIIRLLYDIALRRGEVVSLDCPEDLDLSRSSLWVAAKGRSQKVLLSLPGPTQEAVEKWLEVRGQAAGPLFCNMDPAQKGERLSGRSIDRNIVKPLAKRCGVETSPHGLRHTAITEAVKIARAHGIGLEEVLDFSRHKDVRTLMIYNDRERNVQGRLANLVSGEEG